MLVALVATGRPLEVLTGEALFGVGTSDIWGHAWAYQRMADDPGLWSAASAWPQGQSWWVIDAPVALLLIPVTLLASAAVAYNVAFLLHVGVGAAVLAAWLHGRVPPAVAVFSGVLVTWSPFVRGAFVSGLPEALGVLLVPAFAWALWEGVRGSGKALALSGVLGALVVLDGAYGALWVAIAGPVVVLSAGVSWRHLARGLAAAVPAVGAVALVDAALNLTEHPAFVAQHDVDAVRLVGTDLVDFVVASDVVHASGHRHVVTVGVVAVALALGAAWRRRSAWPLLVVAALAAVLGLGQALQVAGVETGLPLPGALLSGTGAANLYRVAGLVPVALVGVVALASGRRIAWAAGLVAIALEWTLACGLPIQTPTIDNPAGPVERWLAEAPDPGAVLDLPFDREGTSNPGATAQRTFFLSTVHGRSIASGLYTPAPLERGPGPFRRVTGFVKRGWSDLRPPPGDVVPLELGSAPRLPDLTERDIAGIEDALQRQGFQYVWLDLELVAPSGRDELDAWVTAWLGPPHVEDGLRRAWRLPRTTTHTDPARPAGPRGPMPKSSPSHPRE